MTTFAMRLGETMTTNEDRREVAIKLREFGRHVFHPDNIMELLASAMGIEDFDGTDDLFNRLANLIDPEPELDGLKPCPFCGVDATVSDDSGRHGEMFSVWHQCPNDGGRFNRYGSVDALIIDTGWYDTREQAIEAWNRRADECDREALLDVCREIEDADVDWCIDWADRIRKAIGDE